MGSERRVEHPSPSPSVYRPPGFPLVWSTARCTFSTTDAIGMPVVGATNQSLQEDTAWDSRQVDYGTHIVVGTASSTAPKNTMIANVTLAVTVMTAAQSFDWQATELDCSQIQDVQPVVGAWCIDTSKDPAVAFGSVTSTNVSGTVLWSQAQRTDPQHQETPPTVTINSLSDTILTIFPTPLSDDSFQFANTTFLTALFGVGSSQKGFGTLRRTRFRSN